MADYLNLDYLHTFVVAAKTGKLTTTSDIVYLSHSAVSTQIKKLEHHVGATLFIRNKDALTLTKQGQTLLTYANQLLNLNDTTLAKLKSDDWVGKLVIGVPTDYAAFYTQEIYPRLMQHLPDYTISTVCSRSRVLRSQIEEGTVNFSIAAMESQFPDDIELWEEPLHWVCSKYFDLDAYDRLPVALFSDNCVINDYSLYSLRKSQQDFQVTFTSTMMDNVAACAKAGLAVALLPQSSITDDYQIIPEDRLSCPFTLKIGCTWNHNKPIATDLRKKLIDCVKDAVRSSIYNSDAVSDNDTPF
ncbi:LysR family transcriptional regulator [Levilactobacillus tujiorum]|uniref:LysR family transcriptional regulator n=1 Tax=Levilactobacillus tujiorum TaxID=2912243 RepID=UPI0014571E3F|nr:LysR family transcriptional regulator [Levilactobacillus tujiorum]NLR31562.1 LysR family transcriptional regulator [Levilactobacillus tujiorum]